jgi:hypothetical protein
MKRFTIVLSLGALLAGCAGLPPGSIRAPAATHPRSIVHRAHQTASSAPKPERVCRAPSARVCLPTRIPRWTPRPGSSAASSPTWRDVLRDNAEGSAAIKAAVKLGNGALPGEGE